MYNTKMIENMRRDKANNIFIVFTALLIFGGLGITGCNTKPKGEPPEKLAETYLNYIQNGEQDKAIALYSDKMFSAIPKDNWLKSLRFYHNYYGKLKSYKLELTEKVQNKHKDYNGIYTYLVYKVDYDKQSSLELFTIRQPEGGGTLELAGHYMSVEDVAPQKLMDRILNTRTENNEKKEQPATKEPVVETTTIKSVTEKPSSADDMKQDEKK